MDNLTITGSVSAKHAKRNRVYCPSLHGLSAAQADLAFLMPRMDHNRTLREATNQGDWAAVLSSDPFGSEAAFFEHLKELGYLGLTNWPSSILLDGAIQQSMSTVPASPASEYAYLRRASDYGFQTMAFFRSLPQARSAVEAGLDRLILHPGLLEVEDASSGALVHAALHRLIETIKKESPNTVLWAYTSQKHESLLALEKLPVQGLVWYETDV